MCQDVSGLAPLLLFIAPAITVKGYHFQGLISCFGGGSCEGVEQCKLLSGIPLEIC